MKSLETTVPTQTYLLPGQEFCVGLPWERAQLPRHGMPAAPPPPPLKANALDDASMDADPLSGIEIGRCEVIRRLSLGSSKSLLALRTDPDGPMALVVLKQLEIPESAFNDLSGHAQYMNFLQHVNLARVFPAEKSDEGIFWVSEFASGATLAEISQACRKIGKSVPAGLSLAIAHEAALALGALHAPPGVPHGFIHPESLCVTFEGTAKLLELGMFRVIGGRLLRPSALSEVAPYLAPEQAKSGALADARTDVFSLAATLYECLSGQKLASSFEAQGPFVPLSNFNHALGKDLDAVVLKALSPERGKRFASALDFAKALKGASSAFMWKPAQRADFVGDLFRTRRRRDKVLRAAADEAIVRRRSSQQVPIPRVAAALPPPPPPETPVEVKAVPVVAAPAPKPAPAPAPAPAPEKKPSMFRPVLLGGLAATLVLVAVTNPPVAKMVLDWLSPPEAPPAPVAVVAPPAPKVEAAPEPKAEEPKPAVDEKPAEAATASADEPTPKKKVKARKHHKDDAPLPPWLQPKHGRHS
jgi:serine/threonine-protein kinase